MPPIKPPFNPPEVPLRCHLKQKLLKIGLDKTFYYLGCSFSREIKVYFLRLRIWLNFKSAHQHYGSWDAMAIASLKETGAASTVQLYFLILYY